MSNTERPTLSVAETADLLGISRWLVQQATNDGSLPCVRVGRRILIPRSRLLAWLDGHQDPGAPNPGRGTSQPGNTALTVVTSRAPHAVDVRQLSTSRSSSTGGPADSREMPASAQGDS